MYLEESEDVEEMMATTTQDRVTKLLLEDWEVMVDTERIKDLVAEAEKKEEIMGSTIQDRLIRLLLGGGVDLEE